MFSLAYGSNVPALKSATTLSTLTITGSFLNLCASQNGIMNITYFTASEGATHSASELDRVMLLCAFDFQETVHLKHIG